MRVQRRGRGEDRGGTLSWYEEVALENSGDAEFYLQQYWTKVSLISR